MESVVGPNFLGGFQNCDFGNLAADLLEQRSFGLAAVPHWARSMCLVVSGFRFVALLLVLVQANRAEKRGVIRIGSVASVGIPIGIKTLPMKFLESSLILALRRGDRQKPTASLTADPMALKL